MIERLLRTIITIMQQFVSSIFNTINENVRCWNSVENSTTEKTHIRTETRFLLISFCYIYNYFCIFNLKLNNNNNNSCIFFFLILITSYVKKILNTKFSRNALWLNSII